MADLDVPPPRADIGLADLMRIVGILRPETPEALHRLAGSLGFCVQTLPEAGPIPKSTRAPSVGLAVANAAVAQSSPAFAPGERSAALPDQLAIAPASGALPVASLQKPRWLISAEQTPLERAHPQLSLREVSAAELVIAPHRLRALLTTGLAEMRATRRVDLARLLRLVSKAQWTPRPPRLRVWRLARRVAVWIESGVSMAPLATDADAVVAGLKRLFPTEALQVSRFSGSLRCAAPHSRRGRGLQLPEPGTAVLILSRFGFGPLHEAAEHLGEHRWLPVLRALRSMGGNVLGLTPHEPSVYSATLRASIQLLKWDERSSVVGATGARRGQGAPMTRSAATRSEHVERLAELVSLAADVDVAYLRRARRHLLPAADPGVEVELWNSPLVQAADRRRFSFYPSQQARLRAALAASAAFEAAREVLESAHRALDPVVQLEEHATYLALGGGSDAELEASLGRVLLKLREPSHVWLKAWASFALRRLPAAARRTEPARILGQLVPDGYRPHDVGLPRETGWERWIAPSGGARPRRQRQVWLRSLDQDPRFDLDLALAPFAGARPVWLELDEGELITAQWSEAPDVPFIVFGLDGFEWPIAEALGGTLGWKVQIQPFGALKGASVAERARILLAPSARDPLDGSSWSALQPFREAVRKGGARLAVLRPEGSADWDAQRWGATLTRTGPSEQDLLRAFEALADPPRQYQLRLTTEPQRIAGLWWTATLGCPGSAGISICKLDRLGLHAERLGYALPPERSLAYGVKGELSASFDPDDSLGKRWTRALLNERRLELTSEALERVEAAAAARLHELRVLALVGGGPPDERNVPALEDGVEVGLNVARAAAGSNLEVLRLDDATRLEAVILAIESADVVFLVATRPLLDLEVVHRLFAELDRRPPPQLLVPVPIDGGWENTPFGRSDLPSYFQPFSSRSERQAAQQFHDQMLARVTPRLKRHRFEMSNSAGIYRYPVSSPEPIQVEQMGAGIQDLPRTGSRGRVSLRRTRHAVYRFTTPTGVQLWDPLARSISSERNERWFVVDDRQYDWGADTPIVHAIDALVLYQLHIGTWWSPSGAHGTFASASDRLAHLAALGVNGVLLMPVTETATPVSWGYDPLTPSAVAARYGAPDELKRFVHRAHRLGIAVYLDVVYTQVAAVAAGLARKLANEGLDPWLLYDDRRLDGPWGPRWNYDRAEVRELLIETALAWFSEFHVDGLYLGGLDAVLDTAATTGAARVGEQGATFIRELIERARHQYPDRLLFGERSTSQQSGDRYSFHAEVDHGFGGELRRALAEPSDGRREPDALGTSIGGHRPSAPERRIIFSESHDLVEGSGRLPGLTSIALQGAASALAAVATLTAVGIPSIYQGQELFAMEPPVLARTLTEWASLPMDPELEGRSSRRPASSPASFPSEFVRLYRDLIALRLNRNGATAGLLGDQVEVFHTSDGGDAPGAHRVLAYRRFALGGPGDDVVIVLNLSGLGYDAYRIGVPAAGRWHARLDTYLYTGGAPQVSGSLDARPVPMHHFSFSVELALAPYGALILSQDPTPGLDWRRACAEIEVDDWGSSLADRRERDARRMAQSTAQQRRVAGYLVAPRIVATCDHLQLEDGDLVTVHLPRAEQSSRGRVVARDPNGDVMLIELDAPELGVAPLAFGPFAAAPQGWESDSAGGPFSGTVTANDNYRRPSREIAERWPRLRLDFSRELDPSALGAPLVSEGRVIGHIGTGLLGVPAQTVQALLEEYTQMVQIGEVSFPNAEEAGRRFQDGARQGRLEVAVPVRFEHRFGAQPSVVVSLNKLDLHDTSSAHIHRLSVSSRNVTREGFDLVFSTWADSIVYDAGAAWTAVGPISSGARNDPAA